MSLQLNFLRRALSWVAASSIMLALSSPLMAQVGGPDIDPFEEDLTPQPGSEVAEPQQKTGEELWADAQGLYDAGDYAGAMQIYNAFLGQNPSFGPAHLMRGRCLAAIGEIELALSAFTNAATYAPQSPEPAVEKGQIYLELRDYQNAVAEYSKAVQADPFNADSLLQRGKSQLKLAQLTQQAPSFGQPNTAAIVDQALRSLERVTEIDPTNAEALSQLTLVRSFLGEMDEAIEDARKAVSLDPQEVQYSARLAFAYKGRADNESVKRYEKDLSKAVADYNQAVAAFSSYLQAKGDPNMDQSEFEENPDATPPQDIYLARALTNISLANITAGDARNEYFQSAIDDCNKILEYDIDPQNTATALTERGIAQRLLGDNKAAIESYNDAIRVAGRYPEALIRRGIAYYHENDLDSAMVDFEEAMIQTRDGRAEFWAGTIYARRGDFIEAIRHYTNALRENPGYKPAYNNRGLAYLRTGRYARAADDFGELLYRNPDDSVARSRRDQALQLLENERSSTY